MKIANNILELVGGTPLVRLNKLNDSKAEVLAKLEFFNPSGSVKDRAALAMVEDAEKKGLLKKGGLIIEPTSGNTGIGLALVAAVKGYKLILTMPETMSVERRKFLLSLGAQLVLTDGAKGMKGAIEKALELKEQNAGAFIPQQFENFANSEIHRLTTGKEIWEDTDGQVDIVVAGVGTGGTISGIGQALKPLKPSVKIYAVEPDTSPFFRAENPAPTRFRVSARALFRKSTTPRSLTALSASRTPTLATPPAGSRKRRAYIRAFRRGLRFLPRSNSQNFPKTRARRLWQSFPTRARAIYLLGCIATNFPKAGNPPSR